MSKLLDKQWIRWILAGGYTLFLTAYLLQQPGAPAVEIVAPVAAPDWQREVAFTIGHIIGFGMLFIVWWFAWVRVLNTRATLIACIVAVGLGILVEYLQSMIPLRNASLYDLVVNTIGIGLAWVVTQRAQIDI